MNLGFDSKYNITKFDHLLEPFARPQDFLTILKIVKNWQEVLLYRLGFKKSNFIIELRNGLKIKITKPEDYFTFWNNEQIQKIFFEQAGLNKKLKIDRAGKVIKFNFHNKEVVFSFDSSKQFYSTAGLIEEQFIRGQYAWLDVRGRDVVDIGANIADAAIYFALKGAKHVYAFEPYPYFYSLALKNIKLNKLQGKITLLNEGCGGEEGTVKIEENKNTGEGIVKIAEKHETSRSTSLKEISKQKEIKLTTLGAIIKRFNLDSNTVIKIDCEGCEYPLLLTAKESDLRRFKQMQMEYHYGYLNLKNKLEKSGFSVTRTIPNKGSGSMYLGLIYATRKDK
jgi:FkbM family methyltransferase